MQGLRQHVYKWHAFGTYHLQVGTDLKTFQMPAIQSGASSRLGNAEYARLLIEELQYGKLFRSFKDVKRSLVAKCRCTFTFTTYMQLPLLFPEQKQSGYT